MILCKSESKIVKCHVYLVRCEFSAGGERAARRELLGKISGLDSRMRPRKKLHLARLM